MTNEAGQVTAQLAAALALCSSHCLAAGWDGGRGEGGTRVREIRMRMG